MCRPSKKITQKKLPSFLLLKKKQHPLHFFFEKDQVPLLYKSIKDGLEKFEDSMNSFDYSYNELELHYSSINQITIMLDCGLEVDLLLADIFFTNQMRYMKFIVNELNNKANKANKTLIKLKFLPKISTINVKDFLWQMGSKIRILNNNENNQTVFVKLNKIFNYYKIFFIQSDCNSIKSLPIPESKDVNININDLIFVILLIINNNSEYNNLKLINKKNCITIINADNKSLTKLQSETLNYSKILLQKYFLDNRTIFLSDKESSLGLIAKSEISIFKKILYQPLICHYDINLDKLKMTLENDFKHYSLKVEQYNVNQPNICVITANKNMIKFIKNLYSSCNHFFLISSIIYIVLRSYVTNDKLLIKSIHVKICENKTINSPIKSDQFIVNIPIITDYIDSCSSELNILAACFSSYFNVVKRDKSFISLISVDKAFLLMIELQLKGLINNFIELLTKFAKSPYDSKNIQTDLNLSKPEFAIEAKTYLDDILTFLDKKFKVTSSYPYFLPTDSLTVTR